jgi:hypothetical protein
MDVGRIVHFASQQYPFLVETTPCLDLACCCSIATLTLSELVPAGSPPKDRLTFTLRVCLKTWTECDPPPRSLEVESLVREFLARFPTARIQELVEGFQRARAIEQRLKSFSLSGSRDELVTYSSVIDERGGVREGATEHSYFFVFEGREFLVEDHYCANPECDCQEVHLEFWERVHEIYPQRGITIRQRLMATFTLAGQLKETRFSQESASTTKHLLLAWLRRCSVHFRECRRRYEVIKAVGSRSFPALPASALPQRLQPQLLRIDRRPASPSTRRVTEDPSPQRVGRNDPCPCGSGLKFKRCCARRSAVAD